MICEHCKGQGYLERGWTTPSEDGGFVPDVAVLDRESCPVCYGQGVMVTRAQAGLADKPQPIDRLAFFESLIGKPYKIGARGPSEFDCYGLARHIQNELAGVSMPDVAFAEPTTRAQAEAMLSHPERQAWEEIPEAEARELNLVLMGNVAKRDFHLGTYIFPATSPAVIHIDRKAGVIVDDLPALRASGFNYLRIFRRKA